MGGGISNASTYYGSNEARGKTIRLDQTQVSNGSQIIHTVTAGKTYFLMVACLSYYSTNAGDTCKIYKNLAGNQILRMVAKTSAGTDTDHAEVTFPNPIPFVAGDDIELIASTATITADASIVGWEE